jgi:hypothetical protein
MIGSGIFEHPEVSLLATGPDSDDCRVSKHVESLNEHLNSSFSKYWI